MLPPWSTYYDKGAMGDDDNEYNVGVGVGLVS